MNEMKVTLTVQEWDYILDKITDRPYKEVAGLLAKMMNQFATQRQTVEEKKDAQPSD